MKKPNYGQQQKMRKLDPGALAAYCAQNDFALPKTTVPIGQLVKEPIGHIPVSHPVSHETVLTAVAESEPPKTTASPTIISQVTVTPSLDLSEVLTEWSATDPLGTAARQFFALKSRLEQNAAHSVLNWDEMSDLEATLIEYNKPVDVKSVVPAAPAPLPSGQFWANVVGEPLNQTQKFIRFSDDANDAPQKVLFVKLGSGRMLGRRLRVRLNPNEAQGGYIPA